LAIADRVLLLDRGQIQQEGTPEEIYGRPTSQFSAEFMGSNDRFVGKIAEIAGKRARLAGEGWSLWGNLQGNKNVDADGTGLIRVERLRLADGAGENHLKMQLTSALYLGERWEYQLQLGELRIRMWGDTARPAGECWIIVPPDNLWIF
jgi:iron(III) transport system ATP-binding protein